VTYNTVALCCVFERAAESPATVVLVAETAPSSFFRRFHKVSYKGKNVKVRFL